MIRKLLLPLLAAGLLAGCVTGDYAYRGGDRGDYYYGQPSTEYRYYGGAYGGYGGYAPYGYGGYSPYGYGGYGVPYGYGSPYGYYGRPYGHGGYYNHNPYYRPYQPRPPVVVDPRPDGSSTPPPRRDDRRPPWRNFDELRRRQSANGGGDGIQQREGVPDRPAIQSSERGSRMEQTIRRANRSAEPAPAEHEP